MSNRPLPPIHNRRAVAIISPGGVIHIDKITPTAREAWGLLVDEKGKEVKDLKREGWRCTRVDIKQVRTRTGWIQQL